MAIPTHPVNSLGGVPLPVGSRWTNRKQRAIAGQQIVRNLSLGLDIYEVPVIAGWDIDISFDPPGCWLYEETVTAMQALAVAGARPVFNWLSGLTWDRNTHLPSTVRVETYTVVFRHGNTPFDLEMIDSNRADSGLYRGSIGLTVVEEGVHGASEDISVYVGSDGLFL